jgi:hypothetical protein
VVPWNSFMNAFSYVQAIQGILVYRKQVYFKLPSSPVQCWSCVAWGPLALVDAPGRDGKGEEAPRKPEVGGRVQLTDTCSRQSRKGTSSRVGGGRQMHQLEKKEKEKFTVVTDGSHSRVRSHSGVRSWNPCNRCPYQPHLFS